LQKAVVVKLLSKCMPIIDVYPSRTGRQISVARGKSGRRLWKQGTVGY